MRRNADDDLPRPETAWTSCDEAELCRRLRTDPQGLAQAEVDERLREYGSNVLPGKQPPTLAQVVLHQFKSPLIYILLIAGLAALALGDTKDAVFIFAVILLNAAIGTFQEWRAEQSAHALQSLLKIVTRVRRAGEIETVTAEGLVPGDVVLLESGDKVPADIRLLQSVNLTIDEAFLTGESMPAQKQPGILAEGTLVSEQFNMAFAGATVVTGRGLGLVVATGVRTEVGKIARSITEVASAKPPLVIRMERFSRQIGLLVLLYAGLLGGFAMLRGSTFGDIFFVMVAMVVSAIPEGLPVAMTVALSLATSRMVRRKVVARRLVAVESLGSCTLIASDKTGTLTVNQQTVKQVVFPDGSRVEVTGQGYNDEGDVTLLGGKVPEAAVHDGLVALARAALLCNEGTLHKLAGEWRHSGDSMDVALLALGRKLGLDPAEERRRSPLSGEIPFESERRYAAAAWRDGVETRLVAKGAIEAVLPCCSRQWTPAGEERLAHEQLQRQAEELAAGGYRVLAIAVGTPVDPPAAGELTEAQLINLVLLGLVGFMDPLRPEVTEAVGRAHRAGVKVVMITGDHPATALAIARELQIAEDETQVLTGSEMVAAEAFNHQESHQQFRNVRVFARVTPQQKLRIVDRLMHLGEFVAVTGDGVNDAPALNRANIGVAMGSGTDVAKDAAQIIITDDNFASIVNGSEEGRYAYANVRKVTLLLISTGFAELIVLGSAILAGLPTPFLAAQLLWLNLVTNGIQDVALAFEAGEKGVMQRPPRSPREGIFNRSMVEQVMVSGITMATVCMGAWWYLIDNGMPVPEARNLLLTLLVLMQFYHVLNCRSETRSVFQVSLRDNQVLMVGMALAFAVHLGATQLPLTQSLLRIAPLSPGTWLTLGCLASSVFMAMEGYKWWRRKRPPTDTQGCLQPL